MTFFSSVKTKYAAKKTKVVARVTRKIRAVASSEGYSFKDKSSQIKALMKFYEDQNSWQEEYMKNGDYADNFLVLLKEQSQADENRMGETFKEVWEKIPKAKKKAAWEWVQWNATPNFSHMSPHNDAAYFVGGLGEESVQLSGISGKVNGKDVNDVLKELTKGLSQQEIKTAQSSCDNYVDGDYLYIDMSYEVVNFLVDLDELSEEFL